MIDVTDDFCEFFNSKEVCIGPMAKLTAFGLLPEGVNPEDERVKQIIQWCKENVINIEEGDKNSM